MLPQRNIWEEETCDIIWLGELSFLPFRELTVFGKKGEREKQKKKLSEP